MSDVDSVDEELLRALGEDEEEEEEDDYEQKLAMFMEEEDAQEEIRPGVVSTSCTCITPLCLLFCLNLPPLFSLSAPAVSPLRCSLHAISDDPNLFLYLEALFREKDRRERAQG